MNYFQFLTCRVWLIIQTLTFHWTQLKWNKKKSFFNNNVDMWMNTLNHPDYTVANNWNQNIEEIF